MLTLPPAAEIHLQGINQRLTIAGVIYRRDGRAIRCTQHDEDLDVVGGAFEGVYLARVPVTGSDLTNRADLSADNMEIGGRLDDALSFTGFTPQDIEAGLFDSAPFETLLLQWDDPSAWQKVLRRGYLGEISRTAEGSFQAEWRGLIQLLQQQIGRTYSELCDVKRFGDARCGLDVDALEVVTTVTAVTSRRRFDVNGGGFSVGEATAGYFDLGVASLETGSAAGYSRQIKLDQVGGLGQILLWEDLAYDVQIGDQVRLRPGCDRRFETCQRLDNVVNFRGHGRWIPGIPNIIRAP